MGHLKLKPRNDICMKKATRDLPFCNILAKLHVLLSDALEGLRRGNMSNVGIALSCFLSSCIEFAIWFEFSLLEVIVQKLDYNDSRPDHQPENRAKPGGKRF